MSLERDSGKLQASSLLAPTHSPCLRRAQLAVVKFVAGLSASVRYSPSCLAGDVPEPRPSLAHFRRAKYSHSSALKPVRRRPFTQG
jgi:hypothetical protein